MNARLGGAGGFHMQGQAGTRLHAASIRFPFLARAFAALMLWAGAGTAFATDINVTDASGNPGDPATMTISLANSTGTTFITGRLNYPPMLALNMVVTTLQPGVVFCSLLSPGVVQFQVGSPPGQGERPSAPAADGNACQLSFNIDPMAPPADYPFFWTNEDCGSDPTCNANGAFLTVLGPDYTSFEPPGMPITINTTVGGTGATAEINTSNVGTTDLTILPSGLLPPLSVSPNTQQTLVPSGGDERTIFTVSCDTTDGGFFPQVLNFATNDADEMSLDYPINCIVDGPEADIQPPSGTPIVINAPIAGMPASDSLLLRNTGTQPLTITPSALPAPFTSDGPITLPGQGGPARPEGNGTPFNITCNSPTTGSFSATLTLTTNDANEPTFTYPLQCNVGPQDIDTNPAAGTPINLSTPPGVAANQLFQISNLGGSFLYPTFSGLNPPLSIAPSGKISVAPGVTRDFTITCDSPTAGTFSQVLTVNSNDPDEPTLTFPVNCTVGGPEFDPTPAAGSTIALSAPIGQSTTGTVSIANPGSGTLNVDAGGLTGVLAVSPPQLAIAAGTNAAFTVGCTPADASTVTQTLTLATNDTDEPSASYTATCTGIDPGPRVFEAAQNQNQVAVPDSPGRPLAVQLTQGGSPIVGETVTWTLVTGSGVEIVSPVTATDSTGTARTNINFGSDPTDATIEARDSQNNVATFTITGATGGTGAFIEISSGNNQTGATGTQSDQPIVFVTRGGDLAPIAGVQVVLSVTSGDATIPVTAGTTDTNGEFALSFRFGTTAGPVKIRATIAGTPEFIEATATSFAPRIAPASGDNQVGTPGARLAQPLVVQIAAPATAAKGLGGANVTWTVVAGGGSVSPASGTTDANGRASTQFTLGPAPGLNQVRASVAGAGTYTFNATATGAGGLVFEIASGNNQVVSGTTPSAPLVVRVRNGGTPVAGVRVRYAAASDVTLSATDVVTSADGEASVTATLVGTQNASTIDATLPDFATIAPLAFVVSRGIANAPGVDGPEEEVGAALDQSCPALEQASAAGTPLTPAQRDLLQRCREIAAASNNPAIENTLEELLADETEAQNTAVLTTQAAQFGNLKARLAALRSGQHNSFGGLALATATGALPLSFLPSTLLADEGSESGTSDEAGAEFSRWGFFATGTIGSGDRDTTDSNAGFDYSNYGLTAGVDYRVSDSLVLGAALGLSNNDADISDNGGSLDTQGYSVSGYATWYKDAWYFDGVATWGSNDFEVVRRIEYTLPALDGGLTQVNQLAKASPGGDQVSLALSIGRDFSKGAWLFGPYMRGTYTKVDFDGYSERVDDPLAPGAGFALTVEDRTLKSMEVVLGGKVSYTMSTSWGILMPNFQLEYLNELEDNPDDLVSRFTADPTGTPIIITGEDDDTSYFNIGFGLSAVFGNGKSAFIYYEHRAGQSNMTMDNLALGVRIEF